MQTRPFIPALCGLAMLAATFLSGPALHSPVDAAPTSNKGREFRTVVKPKPLSDTVKNGLEWLVAHQHKNGAWGQGEESHAMGGGRGNAEVPSVGDTCMAAMALMRAGSTPSKGPHKDNVLRAAMFICAEIEASQNNKDLYITSNKGTRIQSKLGTYIDTFLAANLLAELKGNMPDKVTEARVDKALAIVLDKITTHQKTDGTWDGSGWAPVLSQSIATKGLNRAAQKGANVPAAVLDRSERYANNQFDTKTGKSKSDGNAGVDLYSDAGNLGSLNESVVTGRQQKDELKKIAAESKDPRARDEAQRRLSQIEQTEKTNLEATRNVVKRLDDPSFIAGFGSNGGEEFLSYMNISESLVVKGGNEWIKWDTQMAKNLANVQNKDGSWSGQHCITGRTFCTAAATLVLTADRAKFPVAGK